MKPERQRIAIAEACGWIHCKPFADRPIGIHPLNHKFGDVAHAYWRLPDYPNDLNAMHEAEKVLTVARLPAYLTWLAYNVSRANNQMTFDWVRVHATAAQRAEAFLRTIGKWEES